MNQPHGGKLVNKIAEGERKNELETKAKQLISINY